MRLDDVDNPYYDGDSDDEEFYARMFHGNGAEPDTDDDEEFNGLRYHGGSKKTRSVCDHCHYTEKYTGA